MKEYIFTDINKFNYKLVDENGKEYKKNIEFYGLDPVKGDRLYIFEEVIENEDMLTYGPIYSKKEEKEYITVLHNDKKIYLQRYYG